MRALRPATMAQMRKFAYLAGEIETQSVGRDQRAFLIGARAQHCAKGVIQNMRAGVIIHDQSTPARVEKQIYSLAARKTTVHHHTLMQHVAGLNEHILYLKLGVRL